MRDVSGWRIWAMAAMCFATSSGLAFAQTRVIDIPAEDLNIALDEYIRQSGAQLVYNARDVEGLHSHSVRGTLSATEALDQLLDDTGLVAKRDPSGAAILVRQYEHHGISIAPPYPAADPGASANTPNDQTFIEQVVVTGSRTITNGLDAPSPVTVILASQLQDAAPGNIAHSLNELPVFLGNTTQNANVSTGSGSGAASTLNLRGLGSQRTLVLIDGQRVVSEGSTGPVDIDLIPTSLVERVDIVTGGASAAYGSDAVAGVVNFVLDTKYTGLKGGLNGGANLDGEGKSIGGWVTGGDDFDGGRGHIVLNVGYQNLSAVKSTAWSRTSWGVITSPYVTSGNPASATNPNRVTVSNVALSQADIGGLITGNSGPAAVLNGTTFGSGGSSNPFQYGSYVTSLTMSGGSPLSANDNEGNLVNQGYTYAYDTDPLEQANVFVHSTYDITNNITVFVEGIYATAFSRYPISPAFNISPELITIFSGNPYIPAQIQQIMTTDNIPSFTMGRLDVDWSQMLFAINNTTERFVGGFQGSLGGDWSFNSYFEHGVTLESSQTHGDENQVNEYRSFDAVVNPANGQIVCNSTLQNPNSTNPSIANCVPTNLFGPNAASSAATAYDLGTSVSHRHNQQDVANFNVNGKPISDWAGPISFVFGAEYRNEFVDQADNAISAEVIDGTGIRGFPIALENKVGGYERTNIQPLRGSFHVMEGFGEADIPLTKDAYLAKSLDLNLAFRYADYSQSGTVPTWKIGSVYQPVDGLKIRITQSRDVRAPNVSELDTPVAVAQTAINDPADHNAVINIPTETTGNPHLSVEKANTTTFGISLEPDWLQGFGSSVDYYNISIANEIATLSDQIIVNQCYAGDTSLCSLVTRNPTTGALQEVISPELNLAKFKTSGIDYEINYITPVSSFVSAWTGDLSFRLLANYLAELETASPGIAPGSTTILQRAGDLSNSNAPRWRGNLTVDYDNGPYSVFVQERYIGAGKYDTTFNTPSNMYAIDNNTISAEAYTDITLHYRFGAEAAYDLSFTVTDLFNGSPPDSASFRAQGTQPFGTSLYDFVGRCYTLRLQFKI